MFEKQIAAGVRWLDKHFSGWLDKIDLDKLNLLSTCNCILGQNFGDYNRTVFLDYTTDGVSSQKN